MNRLFALAAALTMALSTVPVTAHHSTANFNFSPEARKTITGTVTYWSFTNPHSFIDMEVTAADGSVTPYKIFLTSRVVLQRYGWRPGSLDAGDTITVEGSPDFTLPHDMYLQRIVFPDGDEWRRDEVAE